MTTGLLCTLYGAVLGAFALYLFIAWQMFKGWRR